MPEDLFSMDANGEGPLVLRVHVRPGAGRSVVVGRFGDALHVNVAAPPTKDRANSECIALIAEILGVDAAMIELASGALSRDKRFKVRDLSADAARKRLDQAIEEAATRPGAARSRTPR